MDTCIWLLLSVTGSSFNKKHKNLKWNRRLLWKFFGTRTKSRITRKVNTKLLHRFTRLFHQNDASLQKTKLLLTVILLCSIFKHNNYSRYKQHSSVRCKQSSLKLELFAYILMSHNNQSPIYKIFLYFNTASHWAWHQIKTDTVDTTWQD